MSRPLGLQLYEWDVQRGPGGRLVAFLHELKRDPELATLMREREQAFGIAKGSWLHRVLQA